MRKPFRTLGAFSIYHPGRDSRGRMMYCVNGAWDMENLFFGFLLQVLFVYARLGEM